MKRILNSFFFSKFYSNKLKFKLIIIVRMTNEASFRFYIHDSCVYHDWILITLVNRNSYNINIILITFCSQYKNNLPRNNFKLFILSLQKKKENNN